MKRIALACLIAVACTAVRADKTIYGGDVATSGVSTNDVQTRILFAGMTGGTRTYTLSSDTTIHSGGFPSAGNATDGLSGVKMDFSDGNHTLKLASGNLLVYQHHQKIQFIGGVWDLNGQAFIPTGKPQGAGYGYSNLIELSGGCVMTNMSTLGPSGWAALCGTGYGFHVTDASTLHVKGTAAIFYNCNVGEDVGESRDMLFEISDGSHMRCNDFQLDANSSSPDLYRGNVFRVTGEGTVFKSTGSFMIGYGTRGNVFEVADNAAASIYYPRLGQNANTSETGIRVTGGGSLSVGNSLLFGTSVQYGGMFLHVLDGGEVTVGPSQSLTLDSRNNEVVVSNGVLSVGSYLRIGSLEGATGNMVRVTGPESVLTTGEPLDGLFGLGSGNSFVVDGGADIENSRLSFATVDGTSAGSNNTVKVSDGSTFTLTEALNIGRSKRLDLEQGNTLVVSGGGRLDLAKAAYVYGTNNTVIVSNGTFNVTIDTSSTLDTARVCFGSSAGSSNCALIVQGDSPRILIPNTSLLFTGGAKLRFDLPAGGYKDNLPPLEIQQIMNYTMDYEFNGLAELQASLTADKDIDLVAMSYRMWDGGSATEAISRANAVLEATNPGCYLAKRGNYKVSHGETLYLHVKHTGYKGLVVSFK